MKGFILLLVVVCVGCGDPNEKANELYVEAVKLISSAEEKTGESAIKDYEKALANLRKIVDDYSKSDLAVKLVSNETLFTGKSLKDIETRVAALKRSQGEDQAAPANSQGGQVQQMDTVVLEDEWQLSIAPDLRVQPVNSRGDVLLSEQRDVRPVLLAILNTRSVSSQQVIEVLKELHRDIPASDLLILVVSHREEPAALTAAMKAKEIRFLVGKAVSPVEPYKDALSPTVFAIDHNGNIRRALVGNDAGKADNLRTIARGLVNSAKRP